MTTSDTSCYLTLKNINVVRKNKSAPLGYITLTEQNGRPQNLQI